MNGYKEIKSQFDCLFARSPIPIISHKPQSCVNQTPCPNKKSPIQQNSLGNLFMSMKNKDHDQQDPNIFEESEKSETEDEPVQNIIDEEINDLEHPIHVHASDQEESMEENDTECCESILSQEDTEEEDVAVMQKVDFQQSEKKTEGTKTKELEEWIIKPVPQCQGVCVEGKLVDSNVDEFWHSSVILERIDSRTVASGSGSMYKLLGNIDTIYAIEAGFSEKIVSKFRRGFPENWKQLIESHFKHVSRMNARSKSSKKMPKQTASTLSTSIQGGVYSPWGGHTPTAELQRTRSGRAVKPSPAWWMGQKVVVDEMNNSVHIQHATSYAEKVHQDITEMYQNSAKRVVRSKLNSSTSNSSKNSSTNKILHKKSSKNKTLNLEEDNSVSSVMSEKGLAVFSSDKENKSAANPKNVKKKTKDPKVEDNVAEQIDQILKKSKEKSRKKPAKATCYGKSSEESDENVHSSLSDVFDMDSDSDKSETDPKPPRKKKNGKISEKSTCRKKASAKLKEQLDSEGVWSVAEEKRLQSMMNGDMKMADPEFWHIVALKVQSKTAKQCQAFYENQIKSEDPKSSSLTAGAGTLKRRQQLRELMDQHEKDAEEATLCDTTPFKILRKNKTVATENFSSKFEELAKRKGHFTKCDSFTPQLKAQAKKNTKTPAMDYISPYVQLSKENMVKADRYVHNVKKKAPKHKHTPVIKKKAPSTPSKILFPSPSNLDSLLVERESSENHVDSEHEVDYYWSDASNGDS